MFQLDIKIVFLSGDFQEEVHIEQSPSYVSQGENKACRLKKAIYGFKQSPQAWFEKFSIIISDNGFHSCHSDLFVFICHTKSGIIVLTVYVDNILLCISDSAGILEIKEYLKRQFVIKNMRRPK